MPKANLKFDSNGHLTLKSGLLLHNSGVARGEFRSLHADFFQSGVSIDTGDTTELVENEEYAEFNFRMLSAVLIEGYWTDFRKEGVLESATELFKTKIYTDHQRSVRNSLGITRNPVFTKRKNIPGVDSVFRIYKAFGLDVIARLKIKPALIDANSVGITFAYERSHPQLENFYERLGEVVDGQIVRLIVTKILSVPETSLVAVPADDTARKFSGFDFPQSNLTNLNNQEDKMKIKRTILSLLGVDSQKFGLSSWGGRISGIAVGKNGIRAGGSGENHCKTTRSSSPKRCLAKQLKPVCKTFWKRSFS
ncbi:hypothetical protein LEP1GSC131_1037 [Leptospira kirschneri str. 200802841]|uniref:Uncharacterized protein n=1 Tax=Leptospira kirschneri str. 200802841 TaxID=1193047 RepID=A0A828Y086_9LEPT|nr:hypothetical protein LEP1GSC131_1037 [Leptospira kirschneri str. 200802841]